MNGRQHKKMFLKIQAERGPSGVKAFFAQAQSKGSKKLRRRWRAILRVLRSVRRRETPEQKAKRIEMEAEEARIRAAYKAVMTMIRVVEQKTGKPVTIDLPQDVVDRIRDQALKEQAAT